MAKPKIKKYLYHVTFEVVVPVYAETESEAEELAWDEDFNSVSDTTVSDIELFDEEDFEEEDDYYEFDRADEMYDDMKTRDDD